MNQKGKDRNELLLWAHLLQLSLSGQPYPCAIPGMSLANGSTPQTCAASPCAPAAGTGTAADKLLLWLMVMNSNSTLQRCWALGHPWALTTLIKWLYLRIREARL